MTDTPAKLKAEMPCQPDKPGSYTFFQYGNDEPDAPMRGMSFACPCGCGAILGVNFNRWTWDGNREAPTISPSIQHLDGCRWHGFLRGGYWETV